MNTITVTKKEYESLLDKALRYEYIKREMASDAFSVPPLKNKKAVSRSRRGKKALVEAPPEQSFWMSSGLMLPNLRSLEEALRNMMTDEEFENTTEIYGLWDAISEKIKE